jgi:predicted dehydrogenase
MSKEDKIVIGQIGIGYWGPNLLRNFNSNKKCEIKKVVDLSSESISKIKDNYKSVHFSQDLDSIYDDDEINAVVIATPVHTHYELSIRALNSRKHIFVEKPMAQNESEMRDIIRISEEKNLLAMVGHTYLYNSAIRLIKKMIDNHEIGKLRYIYCERTNLGKIRSDVDALWNLAPHDISIIQYLLDDQEPTLVIKNGMSFIQKGIDDVSFMQIKYKNNIEAFIHASWLHPLKKRRIVIVGSERMIIFDDMAENKVSLYNKSVKINNNINPSGTSFDFDYLDNGIEYPTINWQEPLKVETNHFIDCILKGNPCLTDASHAMKVVKILSTKNS